MAQRALLVAAAVGVDHEDIRFHGVHGLDEIEHPAAGIYKGVGDITYRLDHVEALFLRVDRPAVFEFLYGLVGSDADIEVAIFRSLLEERHVPRVEHVVTSGDEYFLSHIYL